MRSAAGVPSLSRLSTPIDGEEPTNGNVVVNGLWICQVVNSSIPDQDILENFNYVGIYNRGNGELLQILIVARGGSRISRVHGDRDKGIKGYTKKLCNAYSEVFVWLLVSTDWDGIK